MMWFHCVVLLLRYDANYDVAISRAESCDLVPLHIQNQLNTFHPGRNLTDGKIVRMYFLFDKPICC